jgi:hypothetical protein
LVPQRLITHDGKDRAEHDHKGGPGDDTGMARHEAIAHGLHQGGEDEIHHAAKSGEPAKRRDEHPPVGHPKIMGIDDDEARKQGKNAGDEDQRVMNSFIRLE